MLGKRWEQPDFRLGKLENDGIVKWDADNETKKGKDREFIN